MVRGIRTLYVLVLISAVALVVLGWIAFRQEYTDDQLKECQEVMQIDQTRCAYLIENHIYVVDEKDSK